MIRSLIIGVIIISCAFAQTKIETRDRHPDVGKRVPELVSKYGYPIENHTVETSDHYLLTVHHIPYGKNNADVPNKPVVFLMHGLLCSSADWVLMGPDKGLAYLLADLGYDVWMGNARGNTYSRNHTKLDPDHDKKKFWDFSWHEIGMNDLPAMIDYVLNKTGETQLSYIGHSQGTTAFFVMASSLPAYNNKIKVMISLAPVAFMGHLPNFAFNIMAKFVGVVSWIKEMLGIYEFLPSKKFMQELTAVLCDEDALTRGLCDNILFLIAGYDKEQLNSTMVPVILSNTPAGASTKQMLHYAQEVNSRKFRQYDYGINNCFHYKFCKIPEYQVSKITAPIIMFRGKRDLLTAQTDVDTLYKSMTKGLPHTVFYKEVDYPYFSHLDFLWANDVVKLLYSEVFDYLERFNK